MKEIDKEGFFTGFTEDQYIPSIGEQGIEYTKLDKDLLNEAIFKGYMSSERSD